ncbi:MAG: 30S ribosomal protein S12 methylthiotransferase RimO [Acutalibacteraceae bacterium]|jgi:ribosomal protein S12 methylthiotransferase
MNLKVGLISLGCAKNQVDAEIMLASLIDDGFELVDYLEGADAVIINTCGFIDDAKKEAIETILEVAELKKEGIVDRIIVTGCLAQLYRDEILNEIPEIDCVLGLGANADVADYIRRAVLGERIAVFPDRKNLPLSGKRMLITPPHWSYLRIAEGCSNCCAYCSIPIIRGGLRSREIEDIIEEAETLSQSGTKELILVAQDTTAYGMDLYGKPALPELLEKLSEVEGIEWIRLMYCHPEKMTDELIETIATNSKVLHYLDMAIQHINDDILSRMNRRITESSIRILISKLRERIPDIALRTTVITGLPGEGEEEFEQLAEFVNETAFERLGCFAYSPQESTPAGKMTDRVDEEEALKRAEIIRADQFEVMQAFNLQCEGKILRVLVEGYDHYTDSYYGRSYMDAPEVDNMVFFTSPDAYEEGDFVEVEVFGVKDYDLLARALDSER